MLLEQFRDCDDIDGGVGVAGLVNEAGGKEQSQDGQVRLLLVRLLLVRRPSLMSNLRRIISETVVAWACVHSGYCNTAKLLILLMKHLMQGLNEAPDARP